MVSGAIPNLSVILFRRALMLKRRGLGCLHTLSFVLILVTIQTGCKSWSERGAKGLGELPKASPDETKFSPYQPANPYQQLTTGLLGRKLHATSPEAGAVIEVHDFLVGPNQRTASYTLPGPAIFEIRSGNGLLKLGDKSQQIQTGMVLPLPAAQPFTIENQSEVPIGIRVEILGSK
jgi:mannose-6-phosphate isomerase-like protein (cupin superfamily)